MPATVVVVHHSPSERTASIARCVVQACGDPALDAVQVRQVTALEATAQDVLSADAVILGTPANIGYISGALKHFFDSVYIQCENTSVGLPFSYWIHGESDISGAVRALDKITTGLRWKLSAQPVHLVKTDPAYFELLHAGPHELGLTMGAVAASHIEP